jgi:hypothetical protein
MERLWHATRRTRFPLALLAIALLAPSQAAAVGSPVRMTVPIPADGKVSVLTADLTAKAGGAAPLVRLDVTYPKALKGKISILGQTQVGGRTKRLTLYVLNPKDPLGPTRIAEDPGPVTVTASGEKVEISAANVKAARDGFSKLTDEQKKQICNPPPGKKGPSLVKKFLGLEGKDGNIVARSIADVICNKEKANEAHIRVVEAVLNIKLPRPKPEPKPEGIKATFGCSQDPGNDGEGDCTFKATRKVRKARIRASGSDRFGACFTPSGSCSVNGQSIDFSFTQPTDQGELHARLSTGPFKNAQPWTLALSEDGTSFTDVASFTITTTVGPPVITTG